MSNKPAQSDTLKARIARSREINISVIGRKSGRTISIPVWFVLEDDTVYLVPVQGSDTQWYKNVLKNTSLHIRGGGAEAEFKAVPITDGKQVASVVDKFRAKYGANDVINSEGAITGSYIDASSVSHGFLLGRHGAVIKFDAPGAGTGAGQGTFPLLNSAEDAITGYEIDTNGAFHGFLRSP